MNVLETIKNDKPTVAAIKDYYNKVSVGLNLNNYQYFYFQCSEMSTMEDSWWDYGFSTSDFSIDENNMIAIAIDEFVYYKDKQIQEILDKLESNAVLAHKRYELQEKMKRIKQDF